MNRYPPSRGIHHVTFSFSTLNNCLLKCQYYLAIPLMAMVIYIYTTYLHLQIQIN
jgi:hypothetical protein